MGTGKIRYFTLTGPIWDQFTGSADPAVQAGIRDTVGGLGTFSPYFDAKLTWMGRAFVYFDSYAIFAASTLPADHPEWILHDVAGNHLYIPWGCANGVCPQYAGDISNPAFVAYQIAAIKTALQGNESTPAGYAGLWLDDVNLNMSVSNGAGALVAPIDRATGRPMLPSAWRNYFATYVEMIRAALPQTIEILHNSVWSAALSQAGVIDPFVRRQLNAADYINVERGFGDPGITGGAGFWSLSSLMNFIDQVHLVGSAVVIEDYFVANRMYSVACYLLIANGSDFIGFADQTPANWSQNLYTIALGPAVNARHKWGGGGVWRRDFYRGFVLANEPGAPPVTFQLPADVVDVDGALTASVTLGPMAGAIFRYGPT